MKDISFSAGYYEWNVWVDDEKYYTFNDLSEYIFGDKENDYELSYEEWGNIVDDLIQSMNDDIKDSDNEEYENKELLNDDELQVLYNRMIDTLTIHYGVK